MEQCDLSLESSFFEPGENRAGLSSDKLLWLVKEEIVFLTGGRDKKGCPILSCPSKKETDRYAVEDLQLLIGFLLEIPNQDDAKKGFTILVDMRRCTWNTIKPLLRAFDDANGGQKINLALVIKPENFLQKQKANFGSSKLSFETSVVSLEALFKYVDRSQVTEHFEGTLKYDHNQWINLRLQFESFVWRGDDFLKKLEKVQEKMSAVELAADSQSALIASSQHQGWKKCIPKYAFNNLRYLEYY